MADARTIDNGNTITAWGKVISQVGIPGVIAMAAFYYGATELPRLSHLLESAIVEIRQTRDLLREHMDQTDMLIRVLQRACSNSAKDENARQRCFDK